MKRFSLVTAMTMGAAMVLSMPAARAADDLPKAETILDKYVEATGGKAAYEKHHAQLEKGTMEMAAMGIKGQVTSYHAAPNKTYSEIEIPGFGKIMDGSDGTTFWQSSAMTGPHVKEGTEKAQALLTSRYNAEVNWRSLYKDTKTTGVDTVDGKECYKVVLTPNEGSPITQCYDKASNLVVKMTMTASSPMGEQMMESYMTDYRKEGDLLVPHKVKQSVAGQEIVMTVQSIVFDPEIPADRFNLPDDIKALVNKK